MRDDLSKRQFVKPYVDPLIETVKPNEARDAVPARGDNLPSLHCTVP